MLYLTAARAGGEDPERTFPHLPVRTMAGGGPNRVRRTPFFVRMCMSAAASVFYWLSRGPAYIKATRRPRGGAFESVIKIIYAQTRTRVTINYNLRVFSLN